MACRFWTGPQKPFIFGKCNLSPESSSVCISFYRNPKYCARYQYHQWQLSEHLLQQAIVALQACQTMLESDNPAEQSVTCSALVSGVLGVVETSEEISDET